MNISFKASGAWTFFSVFCAILCLTCLLFAYPSLFDPDSYYNIAISKFIRDAGFHYEFKWTAFCAFNGSFADKDLLLHIATLPFLCVSANPALAGKLAIIALATLFLLTYAFILRKYLPNSAASLFILLPLTSWIFFAYLLQLRSATLSNIFAVLGIYSIINKKFFYVFVLALIYPLAHASFFIFVIFAFICEALRAAFKEGFCVKNILFVLIGCAVGCIAHPNFPDNLFLLYLNGLLVPRDLIGGMAAAFSGELGALDTRSALTDNIMLFFAFNLILWILLMSKKRAGLSTAAWLAASIFYLTLALFSMRYWYQANLFIFIALASLMNDVSEGLRTKKVLSKISILIISCLIIASPLLNINFRKLTKFMKFSGEHSLRMEKCASWMSANIPAGKTVYHSYYDDSSYFICLNPANSYINTNDPVFMYSRYPREFAIMKDLSMGRISAPWKIFEKIFRVGYGYVRKIEPLFWQIRSDPEHFKIIYEDSESIVFELIINQKERREVK
jgi:hypothetical protein